jgi:DNA-binding transcriptional LysR family regulator
MQLDAQHLDSWLESGTVDFAMGSFPGLIKGVRRQRLWTERYVSVARRGHPRLGKAPTAAAFAAEKHVLVSTAGTGHANQLAERAVEAAVEPDNIICRVPLFTAAAVVAGTWTRSRPCRPGRNRARTSRAAILDPPIKLRASRSITIGMSAFTATPAMRGSAGCLRGCFEGTRRARGVRKFIKMISLLSFALAL